MKRAQVNFPDDLYSQLKKIAKLKEWSINELIRRSAEHSVQVFMPTTITKNKKSWKPPEQSDLGKVLVKADKFRELANE